MTLDEMKWKRIENEREMRDALSATMIRKPGGRQHKKQPKTGKASRLKTEKSSVRISLQGKITADPVKQTGSRNGYSPYFFSTFCPCTETIQRPENGRIPRTKSTAKIIIYHC